MKKYTIFFIAFLFIACSNDEETLPVIAAKYSNLHAPQSGGQGQPISGPFTKFSFETGEVTEGNDWDIAFRGTTILVNGGTEVGLGDEPTRTGKGSVASVDGVFSSVISADGLSFTQDSASGTAIATGSGNGWYLYNPQIMVISPIPGKVFVFETNDGHYAKVEFLSYYKDSPANPNAFQDESRYYTFNYIYNPNKGETSLQ
jgi:hypothetical protein